MIRVNVKKKDSEIIGFRVEGHAGFAESGSDIVCASVSALVINCINSIDTLTNAKITLKEDEAKGIIDFTVTSYDEVEVKVLLKSLDIGLTEIAKGYRDYVTFH